MSEIKTFVKSQNCVRRNSLFSDLKMKVSHDFFNRFIFPSNSWENPFWTFIVVNEQPIPFNDPFSLGRKIFSW